MREEALALRPGNARAPTAVLTHGANPGLVSHFVKQALLNIAADTGVDAGNPKSRADWGELARKLGVKVIHIAERDTQVVERAEGARTSSSTPGRSTASSARARSRPSSAGARTRSNFPRDGKRHDFGCLAAIYLMQPGAATRVRTWTPMAGHFHGFLITHGEAISIADYLHRARGRAGGVSPHGALRLSPVRFRGGVGARVRRPQLAAAGAHSAS